MPSRVESICLVQDMELSWNRRDKTAQDRPKQCKGKVR